MRIAMLAPRANVRGPLPKHTPLLVDALRRRGCEVELLPWGRRSDAEVLPAKLFSRARDVAAARRRVVSGRFPVVVVKTAHDWSTLARDLLLLRVLKNPGRTLILQFHGSQSRRLVAPGSALFKRATAAVVRSADGLLVLSQQELGEWQAFTPDALVQVVRNPRPTLPEIVPAVRDGRPTILCVSRLLAEKGVLDLVNAMPQLTRRTSCRLVLAGAGPDAERARALSLELGVEGSVDLPGYVTGERLAGLYSAADVFALPTSWNEGFPTVILEAMGAGLPVVTTRSRGPADHLVEGVNALFVRPGDPVGLAASLARLIEDPELRDRMSEANREKVKEFDPDPVADGYLQALEHIVAAAQARNGSRAGKEE